MPPQKTRAVVLNLTAYRETSALVYLFTEESGLIHGIARGIRAPKKGNAHLERGFIIETLVYTTPHRTLHTLGAISVLEFFPGIRGDLKKSSIRDTAFELILNGIHASEPNRPLFQYFHTFMTSLDCASADDHFPFLLWRFCFEFAAHLGFQLNITRCLRCGKPLAQQSGGSIDAREGGVVCARKECGGSDSRFLPAAVLNYLRSTPPDIPVPGPELRSLTAPRLRAVTRSLLHFCQYHFEMRRHFKSADFLCDLI